MKITAKNARFLAKIVQVDKTGALTATNQVGLAIIITAVTLNVKTKTNTVILATIKLEDVCLAI